MRALAEDPLRAQERVLARLVERAGPTAFGREHGLSEVRGHDDLRRRVPLRDYAGMALYWDRARGGEADVCWPGVIRYWAISSGTTAGEKYIPVSAETIHGNRRGGWDSIVPHLAQSSRDLFGGKLLFLGGCTELRREGDVWIGDNTGIMMLHIPWLLRRWHTPAPDIARLPQWEEKIARSARTAVDQDLRMLSGVPSWVILFCEHVLEVARQRGEAGSLRDIWPNLSLFVHGGVSFAPYRGRFRELAGDEVECTDTYSASEGGMLAVQDRADDPGMLPLVDQGVYFEFVPASELGAETPSRLGLHEVEPAVDYAVALNTDSGIFGYLVGDLVRFTSVRPWRLVFAGRTAHTLNAFGEHVSGAELDRAIAGAAEECGAVVAEYAVAPVFPQRGEPCGGHVFYVEFRQPPAETSHFGAAVDRLLQAGNEDYTTHRSYGLTPPRIATIPAGGFYEWMKARGKLGGQNKVPRVLHPELEAELVEVLTCKPKPT